MSVVGTPHKEMYVSTNCHTESEITKLVWDLENFQELFKKPWTQAPKLRFDAGSTIGLPSKWAFSINIERQPYRRFQIRLAHLKSPDEHEIIHANLLSEIVLKDGTRRMKGYRYVGTDINFKTTEVEIFWALDKDMTNNQTLTIHLTFELFAPEPLKTEKIGIHMPLKLKEEGHHEALAGDLEKLLDSEEKADVTFQFENGEILKAHKTILGARSPVFLAMFQTEMKESSTGVVHLNDITFQGMKILLKFIYCGKMDEKWKEGDIIPGLLNASEKYSLPALKQFFNHALHTLCTNENVLDILKLARLYELDSAEKNVLYFIKKHAEKIF